MVTTSTTTSPIVIPETGTTTMRTSGARGTVRSEWQSLLQIVSEASTALRLGMWLRQGSRVHTFAALSLGAAFGAG